MLSLLLRRRRGDGTGQQIDLGAVLDHMAGSGAQAEGENSGEGFTPNPSPITGSGSERTNGPGDLLWLLPKARQLDTPRKAVRKNILLDMAQRAQPVIQEVEARKHWSTQSRENPAQGETC